MQSLDLLLAHEGGEEKRDHLDGLLQAACVAGIGGGMYGKSRWGSLQVLGSAMEAGN